jgi:hypothetical protein
MEPKNMTRPIFDPYTCCKCGGDFNPTGNSGALKKQIKHKDGSHSHYVFGGHLCEVCMSPKEPDDG